MFEFFQKLLCCCSKIRDDEDIERLPRGGQTDIASSRTDQNDSSDAKQIGNNGARLAQCCTGVPPRDTVNGSSNRTQEITAYLDKARPNDSNSAVFLGDHSSKLFKPNSSGLIPQPTTNGAKPKTSLSKSSLGSTKPKTSLSKSSLGSTKPKTSLTKSSLGSTKPVTRSTEPSHDDIRSRGRHEDPAPVFSTSRIPVTEPTISAPEPRPRLAESNYKINTKTSLYKPTKEGASALKRGGYGTFSNSQIPERGLSDRPTPFESSGKDIPDSPNQMQRKRRALEGKYSGHPPLDFHFGRLDLEKVVKVESSQPLLDLHGMTVREATGWTKFFLGRNKDSGIRTINIVTGRGKGSKDGRARIKPAIKELLEKSGFKYEELSHGGCFRVSLKPDLLRI